MRLRSSATDRFVRVSILILVLASVTGCGQVDPEDDGAATSTQEFDPVKPKGIPRLVVLGASYARGWDLPAPDGWEIVNRGIGGEQSFESLERFDEAVVALDADAVLLWGFINDVYRTERSRMDDTLTRIRESYRRMVARAREAGIEPILATEVTVRRKAGLREGLAALVGSILGKSSYQDFVNGHVRSTNAWIREFAEREGLLLLDLEAVLADEAGRRRKAFAKPDGSHISPAGYRALTEYATPLLEERLARLEFHSEGA